MLLLTLLLDSGGLPARCGEATVIRDAYGVPHIFASSEEAGMYAFGYAQAEDRLESLLRNYKQARGEQAELDGENALASDIQTRAYRLLELARSQYHTVSPQMRRDIAAFCAGVNRFQMDHPEKRPSWSFYVTPADVVSFAEFVNLSFEGNPLERIPEPGKQKSAELRPPDLQGWGSNAFVVGSGKTASGKGAIVSLDPHLPWLGYLRWYEAHLACGPLNVSGVTFAGLPMPAVGHNDRTAWANTVNQPDLADVYEERLLPTESPVTYEYQGGQQPLVRRTFTFGVKQPDNTLKQVTRTIFYTHHGPVLLNNAGKAYAVRKVGWGDVGMLDQLRAQCLARSVDEYRRALGGQHVVMFNHLVADAAGHIGYVWAGRIPRHPAGFDFQRPVPGWLKASEWGAVVPLAQLPQAYDPPAGFLQNCNDGPFFAAPDVKIFPSNKPEDYPSWLAPNSPTARGTRLTRLLEAEQRISIEDAKRIATDVLDLDAQRELPPLLLAAQSRTNLTPDDKLLLDRCIDILKGWDMGLTGNARGAALFAAWLSDPPVRARLSRAGASSAVAMLDPAVAVDAIIEVARRFQQQNLPLDVSWGEVHRHQRGVIDIPIDGGGNSLTPTKGQQDASGRTVVSFGPSFRMVVELGQGPVHAWSYAPYGNSDDPSSPHFTDQMTLAATRRYRYVPFTRVEVEAEATSRRKVNWVEK